MAQSVEPGSLWTLIFHDADGSSVQLFQAIGDPEQRARELLDAHDWLRGHSLVAAIQGRPRIRVRDHARESTALQALN